MKKHPLYSRRVVIEHLLCFFYKNRQFMTLCVAVGIVFSVVQQASAQNARLLHEYFELGHHAVGDVNSEAVPELDGSQGRAHIYNPMSIESRNHEPIWSAEGPLSDYGDESLPASLHPQGVSTALDNDTDRVQEVSYFATFQPSVVPFKRVVSHDAVIRQSYRHFELGLSGSTLQEITEIGDSESFNSSTISENFLGSYLVRAERGLLIPIASVSPGQEVVSMVTEPPVAVSLYRDRAGNFYVKMPHDGLVRLNMDVRAPRFYFEGRLRKDVRWEDFAGVDVSWPTEQVRSDLREFDELLGISHSMAPLDVLTKLIAYFREFEGNSLDVTTGKASALLEKVLQQKRGVCRQRSFVFVVIAQAFGIPSRYVTNEAHAFVEVFWPGQGWRRIDLGGAAEQVSFHQDSRGSVHVSSEDDPFPQPAQYLEDLARVSLRGAQDTPTVANVNVAEEESVAEDYAIEEMNISARTVESELQPSVKESALFRLEAVTEEVLRGERFNLQGSLVDGREAGIGGQTVRIFLGIIGSSDASSWLELGESKTQPDGTFQAKVSLPKTLMTGRWRIYLIFDGSETHLPARYPSEIK